MSDELNLPPFDDTTPDAPAADTPDAPATPGAPPVAAAPELHEVKINGRTFKVPIDELRSGYQRQQDYTAKSMRLAEERRQLEASHTEAQQMRAEREQIKAFLSDRAALTEYLKQLQGFDSPDSPVTAGQMQQLVDRQVVQRQQEMEQRFANMAAELEIKQTATQYSAEIDATIAHVLTQHPELKSMRRIESLLKQEVAERHPSTIEETKALLLEVAKEQAEGLRNFVATEKKKAAAGSAKLSAGIEPPGGTGIQRQTPSFKLGSEELRAAFEASLRGDA